MKIKDVKIRKATKKDKDRILELFNSDPNLTCNNELKHKEYHITEYLTNPLNKIFVVEEYKKVIGVILGQFWKKAKYVYLDDLIIDKKYRKRGIATKLIKHIDIK